MTKQRKWTEAEIAALGKLTDAELADQMGFTRLTVYKKRRSLNIPSGGRGGGKPRAWSEAEIALLGTKIDSSIAETLGISPSTVRKKRLELGIEISREGKYRSASVADSYRQLIPSPQQIRAGRLIAGHTPDQAAELVHSKTDAWRRWEVGQGEDGHRSMHAAIWELYCKKAGLPWPPKK